MPGAGVLLAPAAKRLSEVAPLSVVVFHGVAMAETLSCVGLMATSEVDSTSTARSTARLGGVGQRALKRRQLDRRGAPALNTAVVDQLVDQHRPDPALERADECLQRDARDSRRLHLVPVVAHGCGTLFEFFSASDPFEAA